jgi:RNA-binding protein 39
MIICTVKSIYQLKPLCLLNTKETFPLIQTLLEYMDSPFPNVLEMDIEEFEEFLRNQRKRKRSPEVREMRIIKRPSPKNNEAQDLEARLEVAKRQAQDAQRDDCTVLVLRLHVKASERDVYSFFAKAGVGKVRDVRIIRDSHSNKSKGVAYVEFYTPDAVLKSMALSGQMINGQPITVQASQAEKNRAAAAARQAKAAEQQLRLPTEGPNKIYVGNLRGSLATISTRELRELFATFGEVESVERQGSLAYIQYHISRDAKEAVTRMNNKEIRGSRISVGIADAKSSVREAKMIGDHEEEGTYLSSKTSKAQLMQKLARDNDLLGDIVPSPMPTICLLLTNMWVKQELNLTAKPDFFTEIYDDVVRETQQMGKMEIVHVERESEQGRVWVKFEDVASARKAQAALSGRYFGGRQVQACFVQESIFHAHTG